MALPCRARAEESGRSRRTAPDRDTCWTLIRAAAGRARDRDEFARRYMPTARAYLAARWSASPLREEIEDVLQEVFVECFRAGGALDRADSQHPSGFRAFLYSVTRNVALHAERTRARRAAGSRDGAARRVELLQLRFEDGLPVREIAKRWDNDAARVHREYAKATREFKSWPGPSRSLSSALRSDSSTSASGSCSCSAAERRYQARGRPRGNRR